MKKNKKAREETFIAMKNSAKPVSCSLESKKTLISSADFTSNNIKKSIEGHLNCSLRLEKRDDDHEAGKCCSEVNQLHF